MSQATGPGEQSVQVGTQSGGINVTGDGNHVVVSLGAARAEAAAPADLAAAERMLFVPSRARVSTVSVASWLSPHAGLVAVQPRRDAAGLAAWARGSGEAVMRLVVGAGGQGKTVLGRLVCEQLARHGWLAGFARLPPPGWRALDASGPAAAQGQRWLRRWAEVIAATAAAPRLLPGEAGCLLVVDYAENQVDTLGDLLAQVVAPAGGQEGLAERVRVLLLARHDRDWWPQLASEHPDRDWVHPEPLRLGGLADELPAGDLDQVWADAVDAVF